MLDFIFVLAFDDFDFDAFNDFVDFNDFDNFNDFDDFDDFDDFNDFEDFEFAVELLYFLTPLCLFVIGSSLISSSSLLSLMLFLFGLPTLHFSDFLPKKSAIGLPPTDAYFSFANCALFTGFLLILPGSCDLPIVALVIFCMMCEIGLSELISSLKYSIRVQAFDHRYYCF